MTGRVKWTIFTLIVWTSAWATEPGVPFVENKNQWPSDFRYGANFPNVKVLLKSNSIFFVHHATESYDSKSSPRLKTNFDEVVVHKPGEVVMATFELRFLNSLKSEIQPSARQKTIYNYFFGNDPTRWAQRASSWSEINYHGVYDGIDARIYSSNEQLKYDWIVSPCGDASQIKLYYDKVDNIELRNGELYFKTKVGEIVESKPYAYQLIGGIRKNVPTDFDLRDGVVSFVFPQGYDRNYELVIDPQLIFSSYSGSTLDNWGNTATPDTKGNLYSGGMVDGAPGELGFPVTAGAYQRVHKGGIWDVGILKYDSVGANLLYVTYLGGTGTETPQSMVVDKDGNLLILGATSSKDFPGTKTDEFKGGVTCDPLHGVEYVGGTDLFIAKLSEDGSQLLASRYLGGTANDGLNFVSGYMGTNGKEESPLSRNYGDQLRGDIITDADGNVLIASNTRSADFPMVNTNPDAAFHGGTHDGVVAKLSKDLSTIIFTRLIGGTKADVAYSIKISKTGDIYAAGGTESIDLLGMNGLRKTNQGGVDGWIVSMNSSGDQIINGTYLGTSAYDQSYFIDLATNGDVLAYGQTQGVYPISSNVFQNPNSGQFLHRLKSDLSTTIFSTTFGSGNRSPNISPTAFLVNDCDNIYMAGWGGTVNATILRIGFSTITRNYVGGNTTNMPVTNDAWQKTTFGDDFYLMVLTGDGSDLVYATYLGGTASPTHVDGGTSRFDKRGIVYHAVCAGCGGRPNDFPSYNVPPSRASNRSSNCNNAAFKFDLSSLKAVIQTNNIALKVPGFSNVCLPDGIVFQNKSVGGEVFQWDLGDGTKINAIDKNNITHFYKKPGLYQVKLIAIDKSTCIGVDSTKTIVQVYQINAAAGPDLDICFGSSTRLTATPGLNYSWTSSDNKFTSKENTPLITPEETLSYYVTITDAQGCIKQDTVKVKVVPGMDLGFDYDRVIDCEHRPFVRVINTSKLKEGENTVFDFGDGTFIDADEDEHHYERDGIFQVSIVGRKEFCTYTKSVELRFVTLKVPNVITPAIVDEKNDSFKIGYGSPEIPKDGLRMELSIYNRWGEAVYQSNDYKEDWRGGTLDTGVFYYVLDVVGEVQCKGWVHLVK